MVMVIRTVPLTNTTGAVIAVGGADTSVGQDLAGIKVKRTLAAIDVGAEAGKTQHAQGMIFAEVTGSYIKAAQIDVYRIAGGFTYRFTYLTDAPVNVGYSIANVAGVSTLRLKDNAATANGRLVAGDIVFVTLQIGHGDV